MKYFIKIFLFGVLVISLTSFGGTFSYVNDSDCSLGNSITVGVWGDQADYLEVNVPQSRVTDDQDMIDISLGNIGDEEIVIDRVQIGWNITESDSSNVIDIMVGGEPFFSGSVSHGEIIDGVDVAIGPENSFQALFLFVTPVSGPIDIYFIMADGSRKCILM
ncbi:hypothetical protein [Methanococcoides sp. FTZ1]|uniref:hypothetical protein n=1 Tax=Methanococcoides sp. FTZ1 TaxID=3439061 RepID=UPI003F82EB48